VLTTIRHFHPSYPPKIAVVGVQGSVQADLAITAAGTVDTVGSRFSFTNHAFLPDLQAHLAELRFTPAHKAGTAGARAVAGRATITFLFLIDGKQLCPGRTPVTRTRIGGADSIIIASCHIDLYNGKNGLARTVPRATPAPPGYYDSAATALGLTPLSSLRNNRDTVEIRFWLSVAVSVDQLVRLVKTGDAVTEDFADAWHISRFRPNDLEAFHAREQPRCGTFVSRDGIEGCWRHAFPGVDPRSSWDSIVSLGVLTLRDQRTLPHPFVLMNDGYGVIVEIRKGKSYRWYSYSNPDVFHDREDRTMIEITKALYTSPSRATPPRTP
jgi:hypothetical protein